MPSTDSFPPHQDEAFGNQDTLLRCAFVDSSGEMNGFIGGQNSGQGGQSLYNYDDAEGFMQRFSFFAAQTPAQVPFAVVSNSGTGGTAVILKNYNSGLTNLRRKQQGSANSATSTAGRVLEIRNGRGNSSGTNGHGDDVHTKPSFFSGATVTNVEDGVMCDARGGQTWHLCWYARRSTGNPSASNSQLRMTAFVFGVNFSENSEYRFDFSGNNGVNASSSTISNPATGGSYYFKQVSTSTSWTKYTMTFTFQGTRTDGKIQGLGLRFDNDDGASVGSTGTTVVYVDRPTLHPIDIELRNDQIDTSGQASLQDGGSGTYNSNDGN